jgi:hypothetical protein
MKPYFAFIVHLSLTTAAHAQIAFKPGNDKFAISLDNAPIG